MRSRRSLVALALVAGAAAGCAAAVAQNHTAARHRSGAEPTQKPAGVSGSTPPPSGRPGAARPAPSTASRVLRAVPAGYAVGAAEVEPAAKRLAEQIATTLTTYSSSSSLAQVAAAVTPDAAKQRALADAARPLWHAGRTSRSTVVYPQMGGLTGDAASIMVVLRQEISGGGPTVVEVRTLDIWLTKTGGTWRFDHLDSAGGTPVPRPASLSAEAKAVLGDARIFLPDTARWDIYRGAIDPALLRLMEQIAQRTTYAVTVLQTGHPYDVFGEGHPSMHSFGRALDINLVAGSHVIDQHQAGSAGQPQSGSVAYRLVQWLLAQPQVGQVGAPWDLDGPPSRSFTNTVHLDHIHVSV